MKGTMITLLLIGVLFLNSCTTQPSQPLTLQQAWELEGFNNPESVVFDPMTQALYVSNVAGDGSTKDGVGPISKVSLDGKLLDLNWVEGLNAPKGLSIYKGKLYVADIDTLVEIDMATASITARYPWSDAEFLNDVTAGQDGSIYVSDMPKNRIMVLKDGLFSLWLESDELQHPNGLHAEADRLVVGAWGSMTDETILGHLKAVSLPEKTITDIGNGQPLGHMDGVEPYGKNGYLATDWMAGKFYYVTTEGQATELLDLEQGMADHEYIPSEKLVILPMMNSNKVLAYTIIQ